MGLLEDVLDTQDKVSQEVALQALLGQCLVQIRGYALSDVQQAFHRAWELIDQIGETPQYFQVMDGLHAFYWLRGEYQSARAVAEQNLEASQLGQDPVRFRIAHRQLGCIMMFMGDLLPAAEHLGQSISDYDLDQERSLTTIYGQSPSSTLNIWLGFT